MLAAKGKTQGWLAERADIDPTVLSRVLNGQIQRPDLWQRIWVALASSSGASQ